MSPSMARKSSPPFSPLSELKISLAALERRWISLTRGLCIQLGRAEGEILVQADYAPTSVTAGFVGRACEYVERDRGGNSPVAPLCSIRQGSLLFWLGFHEVWENRPGNSYAFHHVSLTVHLGYEGDLLKPQIFRSEWPGIRGWSGGGIGFQSPGAGHPHWQFDALRTIYKARTDQKDKTLARLRDEAVAVDFDPASVTRDVMTEVQQIALERVHFASAAPWWVSLGDRPYGLHMNAPRDQDALFRWIMECVAYIRQELGRC